MHSLSTLEIDNAVVTGNRCLAGRKKLFYISQRGYYITTKYNEKCDKSPLYCLLSLHRSNIGSRCEHQDSSIISSFATTRLISLVWFIPHIKTHPRSGVWPKSLAPLIIFLTMLDFLISPRVWRRLKISCGTADRTLGVVISKHFWIALSSFAEESLLYLALDVEQNTITFFISHTWP